MKITNYYFGMIFTDNIFIFLTILEVRKLSHFILRRIIVLHIFDPVCYMLNKFQYFFFFFLIFYRSIVIYF